MTLAQLVDAPLLDVPTVSLVRTARTPPDATDGKWALQGIKYLPEANATVGVDDSCGASAGTYTYTAPAAVEWTPYVVLAFDRCTALTSFARDYVGRATRLLEAATPKAVEKEFWTGTLAQAKGWTNEYLQRADTVTDLTPVAGTAVTMNRALGLLEQGLADCGLGGVGVIHCTRDSLPEISASSPGLRRDGNLIRTMVDTLVVPGVGYPGTGPVGNAKQTPDAGTVWLYATGPVEYRYTDPILFPDWPAGQQGQVPASAVDKAHNTVTIWVARTALASWDGQCHLACLATLPT